MNPDSNANTAVPDVRHELRVYVLVTLSSILLAAIGVAIHGIPVPAVHDEFSYLFAGETFARFRLTNPSPPGLEAFFSPHILVEPTFSSKYPPAQGLFLALGTLLGLPIVGVWLSGALAAVSLLWCSRALLPLGTAWFPVALFMLTLLFAGPWVSTYWGGFVTFAGGALVIGFFLRLRKGLPETGAFVALGLGLSLMALSRPYEGLLLCLSMAIVSSPYLWRFARDLLSASGLRRMALSGAIVAAALAFQVALNVAVTGSAFRMPYSEFQAQYLEVPALRWSSPVPPEKPDPRVQAVERGFWIPDSWGAHVTLTYLMAWRAMEHIGGTLLPWVVVVAAMSSLLLHGGLVLAVVLHLLMQSSANYVHLAHYFAPIAPIWFLLPGIAVAAVTTRYRVQTIVGAGIVVLALISVFPQWQHGWETQGIRPHQALVELLTPHAPVLVLVEYDPTLSPHIHVVYNDPDLGSPVILANHGDPGRNCEVVRAFPERNVVVAVLAAGSFHLERWDPRRECDAADGTSGQDAEGD